MGSKRLKAVAITRGKQPVPILNKELLREKAKALDHEAKTVKGGLLYKWGTGGAFSTHALAGSLPTRNYTTSIFPEHEKMNAEYIRTHFEHRNKPCWACRLLHTKFMKVTEGPYAGYEGEEPEYECMAAWGPTRKDLDGLDMRWGNVEGVEEMLEKISKREGIGNLLAEGVKRASEEIGGEAPKMGVYVLKGATPRGHDHRAIWPEMLDTCISATGTIQSGARLTSPAFFGHPPISSPFSPWEVAGASAKLDGWYVFLDSLGVCRFITIHPDLTMDCVNAVTGRGFTLSDALTIGRRIINQLRVFNFRHGLDPALEAPSPRYGSTPTDGPAEGKAIEPHFQWMKSHYFELVGWDPATGKPLPHTLKSLGLEKLIPDLET
jgi:aldehyde:ferredoxin oxidoreductase